MKEEFDIKPSKENWGTITHFALIDNRKLWQRILYKILHPFSNKKQKIIATGIFEENKK